MREVQIFYKDKFIDSFNYDFIEITEDGTNTNMLFIGNADNKKIVALVPKDYLLIFNDIDE